MKWDQLEENWVQFAGSAQARWGKLTNEDWDQVDGKREQLVSKIQQRYGLLKLDAEAQADAWAQRFRDAQERVADVRGAGEPD